MAWVLFFIAVGFALWYRRLYQDAEREVEIWKTSASEWKARVNELVNNVMKHK